MKFSLIFCRNSYIIIEKNLQLAPGHLPLSKNSLWFCRWPYFKETLRRLVSDKTVKASFWGDCKTKPSSGLTLAKRHQLCCQIFGLCTKHMERARNDSAWSKQKETCTVFDFAQALEIPKTKWIGSCGCHAIWVDVLLDHFSNLKRNSFRIWSA